MFIDYLNPGHYHGMDISPEILAGALETVTEYGLQGKVPYLVVVSDLTFGFLPPEWFRVVHAHSVFSHSPIEVIDQSQRAGRLPFGQRRPWGPAITVASIFQQPFAGCLRGPFFPSARVRPGQAAGVTR